jgi:tetratricopeptide (TPR) repeat protein
MAQRDYHSNITAIPPGIDPTAFIEANTIAVDKNNAANIARKAGRYGEAISLHKEALELKLRAFGEESVQAAISYNALGEVYLQAGELSEAEKVFAKALKARDNVAFGGLELGPRNDAAATRDNIAQLREAQGRFEEAKEMRLKGADRSETMCGNYDVRILTLG